MKKFRAFLSRNWQYFGLLSVLLFVIVLAGCGPLTWLTDAVNILPIVGGMISGVLALIGFLTGSTVPATIATAITAAIGKALKGIQDIEAMVAEYKANPSTTLLGSIEAGTQAVIDGINQFLTDTGITDTSTQAKVVAVLTLVLNEVVAFQSLLPALSAKTGQILTIVVPMTSKESKAAYNAILNAPTGNAAVDGALAQLKRL